MTGLVPHIRPGGRGSGLPCARVSNAPLCSTILRPNCVIRPGESVTIGTLRPLPLPKCTSTSLHINKSCYPSKQRPHSTSRTQYQTSTSSPVQPRGSSTSSRPVVTRTFQATISPACRQLRDTHECGPSSNAGYLMVPPICAYPSKYPSSSALRMHFRHRYERAINFSTFQFGRMTYCQMLSI